MMAMSLSSRFDTDFMPLLSLSSLALVAPQLPHFISPSLGIIREPHSGQNTLVTSVVEWRRWPSTHAFNVRRGTYLLPIVINSAFPKWLLVLPAAAAPAYLLHPAVSVLLVLGFVGSLVFFRDPDRVPEGPGVVSPADGVVDRVEELADGVLVSIFMRVRDVHVNRAPMAGRVTEVRYFEGRFRPAYGETSENERNQIRFDTERGEVVVEQVAGVFARRIRCFVSPGDAVERGERIGLIAFSSRVNVLVPFDEVDVSVSVGDTVKAGETVLIRR